MSKQNLIGARDVIGDKAREDFERLSGIRPSDRNESIGEQEKFLLKPSAGRIAVRLKDIERETKSGLVLVGDTHSPKPVVGTVAAVCEEYELDSEDYDPLYRVDDLVVFGKYTGTRIQVGRDIYIILRETDILARLVPSDSPDATTRDKVRINDAAIE